MNAPATSTPTGTTGGAASSASSTSRAELERVFHAQRAAFEGERYPDHAIRWDRLRRLLELTTEHESAWVDAISRDFGHRSPQETRIAECYIVAAAIRQAMRSLALWMKPQRVPTPLHLMPAKAMLLRQPVGVVGVISPWNYPFQLALAPVAAALAAGNRVLLKPSELTPNLAAMLAQKVHEHFRDDELAVVQGDAALGEAFSALPFDHLFFTGSTAVGRMVARAAAENLTPVTLELGGKSPALFDVDAKVDVVAPRLMAGKLLNAGQTCIAPDYALVHVAQRDRLVEALKRAVARLYPQVQSNPDYSTIVNERHYRRLLSLVEEARAKGATIVTLEADGPDPATRKFPPTLVLDAHDGMAVMQEEIFGPLLPIETYERLDDAIERINRRPRPLAFYYFGENAANRERVLQQTLAGGVTVNDTMWHFAHEELPFGGVGASGAGAYHGEYGFLTFSQEKPVFVQRRLALTSLLQPPYGATFEKVLWLLRKLNT